MPTRILLGPDFEDFTMTSENFRWLHGCRWEASHSQEFLSLRSGLTHSLGKFPNLVKMKNEESPETRAQWLLVDEEERALAWAELQTFPRKHDDFGLLLWGLSPSQNGQSFALAHLARLLSFTFVVGRFDHVKVVGSTRGDEELLFQLAGAAGEVRTTLVLKPHPWHPRQTDPCLRVNTFEVAREEWIASPLSDASNSQLKHVATRLDRFAKAQAAALPQQKRRSFLARLFRPKIDDSLF